MSGAAQPFSVRLIAILVAVGFAAFATLLLLFAFGGQGASSRDGRAHPLSIGATGFKGLMLLTRRTGGADTVDSDEDLLAGELVVATIEPQSRQADVTRLLNLRRGLPTVLLLSKWLTMPEPSHRGWVRAIGPGAGAAARLIDPQLRVQPLFSGGATGRATGSGPLAGLSAPLPSQPQSVSGGRIRPVLSLGDGILIGQLGDEPHYLVADPDLFNNHGLKDPATARAALAILARLKPAGTSRVSFDLSIAGMGANQRPNLLRTAFEPPFLPMILALVVAALLAGLHGAFRFGLARREARAIAFGKAALVENSAGLIKLARREARLGGAYAEIVRQDAARLTGAPAHLQGEALDAYLDRLSKDGPSFSALAERLARAANTAELIAAARALFSWKKDIIR